MIDNLRKISIATFEVLCEIKNERDKIVSNNEIYKLIFPKDRQPQKENKIRVSEQEAKQIFIQNLEDSDLFYSVETPTVEKYKFTSEAINDRAGSLDLCLFECLNKTFTRVINIEFKAHNMKNYKQDFEKLFREPGNSMFFHVLESVNNGTLNSDAEKRKGVLTKYKNDFKEKRHLIDRRTNFIYFVIISLKQKFMLDLVIEKKDFDSENIFDFKYRISNNNLNDIDKYNWNISKINNLKP